MINAGKTKLNEDQAYAATFMVPYVEDDSEEPDISEGKSVQQNGVSDGQERSHGTRSPDSISSSEWQMLVSWGLVLWQFRHDFLSIIWRTTEN